MLVKPRLFKKKKGFFKMLLEVFPLLGSLGYSFIKHSLTAPLIIYSVLPYEDESDTDGFQ